MHRVIALAALTMGAPMCAHQPTAAPDAAADTGPGEFVVRPSPSEAIESGSLPDNPPEPDAEES